VPLYEYECSKCHKRTEKIESVSGPHLKKCPHCGGKVERMQSAPAIQFKGAGWYVTDYAGKSASRTEGDAAEKSAEKGSEKASEKSSAKETPKEPAPAKETKESKDRKPSKK
jgi:putative FmdB family regulatory protein